MTAGRQPALRRAPIPLREPRAASSVGLSVLGQVPATQGTLALALAWDAAPAPVPAGQGLHEAGPGLCAAGQARDPAGLMPEPRDWAATFVQAALEVATGMRPPTQLVRWTTPDIQASLARRGALTARAVRRTGIPAQKPRLRALVIGTPATRVCEVAAVVAGPDKVRAVAFRMEGFHGRWRVTELEIG